LAGLSAAVELASAVARVTVVDRNAHLGGKMNILQEHGFAFDMGPTILTLPQVLTGIIERAGRRSADYQPCQTHLDLRSDGRRGRL
jgi:diapolycopene oxygenase